MRKLIVGIILELFVGVTLAGALLGLVIPVLTRYHVIAAGDRTSAAIIVGVLVASLALALLRPGSSILRYFRR